MKLNDVMNEVGVRLQALTPAVHMYDWPVGKVHGLAAIVSYPDTVMYDLTYGRGMSKISKLPIILIHPNPNDRATRLIVAAWTDGRGPGSVKEILERGTYASCDDLTVTDCTFDAVQLGGVDFMAATFNADVTGGGA